MSRQQNNDPRAQAQDELAEALIAAYDEEFEILANTPEVRRALRESIAGKVKRRTLLKLGHALGCKTGGKAVGYMYRAQLARALGHSGDLAEHLPEWDELMAEVGRLLNPTQRALFSLRPFDIRDHLDDDEGPRS